MKKIVPWIVVAIVLIAVGLVSGRLRGGVRLTDDKVAAEAYEEGNAQLVAMQLGKAEVNLRRAVTLDPGFAMAHAALAHLLSRSGMQDQSKQELAIADSLSAGMDDTLARLLVQVRLSSSYYSRYHTSADSLLAAGEKIDPNQLIFLVAKAERAGQRDDRDTVERVWKHVLDLNPNYAAAYNSLGYLYFNEGRYEDAKNAMHKYAFVAPDLANPHDSLGEVLMTVGEYEDAEHEFKLALQKQSDFFWSLVNLGHVYLERGEITRGLALLDQVSAKIEGTSWERAVAARVIHSLYAADMKDDLGRYTQRFIAKFPDDQRTPFYRAMIMMYTGRFDAGAAVIDSALDVAASKLDDQDGNGPRTMLEANRLLFAGALAAAQGDTASAATDFTEMLAMQQNRPPHELISERVRLAGYLHSLRRDAEAKTQLEQVFAINPRTCSALALAVDVNLALGDRVAAVTFLDLLERATALADADYPPRERAQALRARLGTSERAAR